MTETADLWWHLSDAHKLDPGQTHGDPVLMHRAAHAFGTDHEHETTEEQQ